MKTTTNEYTVTVTGFRNGMNVTENMTIVAEGVENEVQANYLIIRGVDFLQGYLYGKAMELTSLLDLLSKEKKNYESPPVPL